MSLSLKILGSAGGAVAKLDTMAAVVNDSILLDVGTGALHLDEAAMHGIRSVVLTHSHLDHTAILPFLLDVKCAAGETTAVYALPETIAALREGIFNDAIWPDMENIYLKSSDPIVSFTELIPYESFTLHGVRITPLPVQHQVPTLGFILHGDKEDFVFISDINGADQECWDYLNNLPNFRRLIIETSYPDGMEELARASWHLTPGMLHKLLSDNLKPPVDIYYCHVKPAFTDTVAAQSRQYFGDRIHALNSGDVFEIL